MKMVRVEIEVPEEIVPYTVLEDKEAQLTRNAMLVYPYIKNGVISHGRAAEMLGIHKIDLIQLYGKLGIPYFDETEDEPQLDEIQAIAEAKQDHTPTVPHSAINWE